MKSSTRSQQLLWLLGKYAFENILFTIEMNEINSRSTSMISKDLYFFRYNQLTYNLETYDYQNQSRPEFLTKKRIMKQKLKKSHGDWKSGLI